MSTPQQKAERNAPRFATAVEARRLELGKTLRQVAIDAGITVETLGALRKGQNYPSPKSAWGLDTALRWQAKPSSTLAIFEDGDPVPLPDEPADDVDGVDPDEQKILAMQHLSAEKKQQIIDRMRANRQAALEEAAALNEVGRLRGHKGRDREGRSRSA